MVKSNTHFTTDIVSIPVHARLFRKKSNKTCDYFYYLPNNCTDAVGVLKYKGRNLPPPPDVTYIVRNDLTDIVLNDLIEVIDIVVKVSQT
jgi:hypothetical protein